MFKNVFLNVVVSVIGYLINDVIFLSKFLFIVIFVFIVVVVVLICL